MGAQIGRGSLQVTRLAEQKPRTQFSDLTISITAESLSELPSDTLFRAASDYQFARASEPTARFELPQFATNLFPGCRLLRIA